MTVNCLEGSLFVFFENSSGHEEPVYKGLYRVLRNFNPEEMRAQKIEHETCFSSSDFLRFLLESRYVERVEHTIITTMINNPRYLPDDMWVETKDPDGFMYS